MLMLVEKYIRVPTRLLTYVLDCCDLRWQADPASLQGQNHMR